MTQSLNPHNAFIGQVMLFAGNFTPAGWEPCDGKQLPIKDYAALFSIIGSYYGGDGRTHFALPDLRCAVPVHAPWRLGDGRRSAAAEWPCVQLTEQQLPPHTHSAKFKGEQAQVTGTVGITAKKAPGQGTLVNDAFLGEGSGTGGAAYIYVPGPSTAPSVRLSGGSFSAQTTPQGTVQVEPAGKSAPVVLPHIAMTWCICVQGLYPSRA